MRSLEGKVALVTGASRGIGRAIAIELARAGASVAINYRTGEAQARAVAEEIGVINRSRAAARDGYIQAASGGSPVATPVASAVLVDVTDQVGAEVMLVPADVSNCDEVRAMVAKVMERWGRLDILVNNAGITRDRTLKKLSSEDWQAVLNTNLNSAFYCTTAVMPIMTEQKFGRIVNVGSMIAQTGNIGQANYAAAKGGMVAFTKSAALELARHNITVNCVMPGFTATEMMAKVPADLQDQIKSKIPLGRFAEPEEIAEAVLFLAAGGDYITGQQINVNGGAFS